MSTFRAPAALLVFGGATAPQLMAALDEVAEKVQLESLAPIEWYFPDNQHWTVLTRFDHEAFKHYTHVEKQLLRACLGTEPSAVLKLLLNQRLMDQACAAATTLVLHMLERFQGIADEGCGGDPLWTVEQVRQTKRGKKFLDCYR